MANHSRACATRLTAYLHDLERRAGARALALQTSDSRSGWRRGLLCQLAEHRLLMPLDQVLGVLALPRTITAVPGTARWMLGIINRHGELLQVYDLRGLLLAELSGSQRRSMALVIAGTGQGFAVTVDRVLGLRRAHWDAPGATRTELPPALAATLIGDCVIDQARIPVVDPARIAQLPGLSLGLKPRTCRGSP